MQSCIFRHVYGMSPPSLYPSTKREGTMSSPYLSIRQVKQCPRLIPRSDWRERCPRRILRSDRTERCPHSYPLIGQAENSARLTTILFKESDGFRHAGNRLRSKWLITGEIYLHPPGISVNLTSLHGHGLKSLFHSSVSLIKGHRLIYTSRNDNKYQRKYNQ